MVYDVADATAPQLIDTWLSPAVTVIAVGAPGRATGGGGLLPLPPLLPPPPPHAARSAAVKATRQRIIPLTRRWPSNECARQFSPAVAASFRDMSDKETPRNRCNPTEHRQTEATAERLRAYI